MMLRQKYSSKQLLSQAALIVTGKHISSRDAIIPFNSQSKDLTGDEQLDANKLTFAKLANSQS